MKIVKPLQDVVDAFEKLPGVGPKSAQRLAFYLLHVPQTELELFADALTALKKKTVLCSICKNVAEVDPCDYCSNDKRAKNQILVVEQPLDIIAFEKTGKYDGMYHVLHGSINPLDNIGPDEIFISQLLDRLDSNEVTEVIIATNPTMEGDATAMYITKKIKEKENSTIKVTRLGMGVPTGADLGYADENTLSQAIAGRREL